MVNECVEKLVSPQVLAMNYNKKPVEELGDAVETLVVLPTSTMKPIKVTLKDQNCLFMIKIPLHVLLLLASIMETGL